MQTLLRLGASTLIIGIFAGSAYASLETGANYSALPKDQIALNDYTATATVACQPAEPHYLPSFIRAADGTIIGVGYVEVENAGDAGC